MGTGEIVLICVVVMVVFGSTKLPQLGDGLGRAIKNFKRAVSSTNEIEVSPSAKKAEARPEIRAEAATEVADPKSTVAK